MALTPDAATSLIRAGVEVRVEAGAGVEAGFPDSSYEKEGVKVVAGRAEALAEVDVVAQVRGAGANRAEGAADLESMKKGQAIIGFLAPVSEPGCARRLAERGVTALAMDLMPRIARTQSMDAVSSMATVAGYKAVLLAAEALPRMFPMLVTAAGAVSAARALVVGADVGGLQAIATARRLGAVVYAYDARAAARETVESLGARFVGPAIEAANAEQMGEGVRRKLRESLAGAVAESDVVITTVAPSGEKAPILITEDMIREMKPGSAIVDLAAERGGNCELTQPGETVAINGVTILGPVNLASTVPYHASRMYARNLCAFLLYLAKDGELHLDPEDEIVRETMVTQGGEVVHSRVREALGLEPLAERPSREGGVAVHDEPGIVLDEERGLELEPGKWDDEP